MLNQGGFILGMVQVSLKGCVCACMCKEDADASGKKNNKTLMSRQRIKVVYFSVTRGGQSNGRVLAEKSTERLPKCNRASRSVS